MALTFQVERFSDVIEDAQPLLVRHHAEIANYRACIPLSPDYAKYAVMEAAGKLLVVTARNDGIMVGYADFIMDSALHYSTVLWPENDILWVAPEYRGRMAGVRLIGLAEKTLKARGAVMLHFRSKTSHPALGRLLVRLGYRPVETVYAKMLQRPE
jgi:GNAT superfamily N-acetyltransferase